jgi:hypothetical protein
MTDTATETQPLTAVEQATLDKLLTRASAGKTPGARIGEAYEALIALSVPRRGDSKDKQTDLVMPGETVYLTEDEARQFERHGSNDGRQVPVIRKLSGADGSREPLPRLLPRHVSGRLFRPPPAPPGSDAPRPDPAGSSRVQVLEDGNAPEISGAMSAEPAEMADHLRDTAVPDAVDLPPRGGRARGR